MFFPPSSSVPWCKGKLYAGRSWVRAQASDRSIHLRSPASLGTLSLAAAQLGPISLHLAALATRGVEEEEERVAGDRGWWDDAALS